MCETESGRSRVLTRCSSDRSTQRQITTRRRTCSDRFRTSRLELAVFFDRILEILEIPENTRNIVVIIYYHMTLSSFCRQYYCKNPGLIYTCLFNILSSLPAGRGRIGPACGLSNHFLALIRRRHRRRRRRHV